VLIEAAEDGELTGRAAHQAPETDGGVRLTGDLTGLRPGLLVHAVVTGNDGADLVADVIPGSAR
jgi:ribosomal protein S12 methylthiotransferase